jgi:Sulfotransferase domain
MPLKVIGAGQGRTGTHSLKLALEQLGLGPCHHMAEVIEHPEQYAHWQRVFDDQPVDWEEVYRGYNSAVDAPTCFVYRELAERYPDAKVILTLRDAESWHRSVSATIMSQDIWDAQRKTDHPMSKLGPHLAGFRLRRGYRPFRPNDRDAAIADFQRHNEEVRKLIPPDRLLVYEISEGWNPLCSFLEIPVPDAPFPHSNTSEQFRARVLAGASADSSPP